MPKRNCENCKEYDRRHPTKYPIVLGCWKCGDYYEYNQDDFYYANDDCGERILSNCPRCGTTVGFRKFSPEEVDEFKQIDATLMGIGVRKFILIMLTISVFFLVFNLLW